MISQVFPNIDKKELIKHLESSRVAPVDSYQSAMASNQLDVLRRSNLYDYNNYSNILELIHDANENAFIYLFEYYLAATLHLIEVEFYSADMAFLERISKNKFIFCEILKNNNAIFFKWLFKICSQENCTPNDLKTMFELTEDDFVKIKNS